MLSLIEKLCAINGVSGDEQDVAAAIIEEIRDHCEYHVSPLGDVIAFKKGKKPAKNKVMFDAHMDEVGFIVTYITDNGFLKFSVVGGIDNRVMQGKPVVVGKNKVYGILASKPVHLIDRDKRDTPLSYRDLSIDIGCSTKEEAEALVSVGDRVYFDSPFVRFGDGFIKSKALDDRAGCALMVKMIQSELEYDTWFSFTTREEVGGQGAATAAYTVKPDIAVAIETTTAADIGGVSAEKRVCLLGSGPAISFMDKGTIYDKKLYELAISTAKENNIKAQPKMGVFGGNNAGGMHKAAGGARPVGVSMPCRYLHTQSCVLKEEDITATYELLVKLSEAFAVCD
ncbi:MAG: M42 family peptidase [Oscillospiraceae bacterium]|nr:M42 family peptidase [Oscillospiraceae bacterium]MBR2636138.1 M42 family peptidase [Oscillospiraceae bacterium]